MRIKQLSIIPTGMYGRYKIYVTYRNRSYSTETTNTLAIDRYIDNETPPTRGQRYNSRTQAARALYTEIKKANNL